MTQAREYSPSAPQEAYDWAREDAFDSSETEAVEPSPLDEISAGLRVIARNGKDSGEAVLISDKLKDKTFTINGVEHVISSIRYDEHDLPMICAHTVTERPQDSESKYYPAHVIEAARTIDRQLADEYVPTAVRAPRDDPAHTQGSTVTERIAAHMYRDDREEVPTTGEKLSSAFSRLKRKIARTVLVGPARDMIPVVATVPETTSADSEPVAPATTEATERMTRIQARAQEIANQRAAAEAAAAPTVAPTEGQPIPIRYSGGLGERLRAVEQRRAEEEQERQAIPVVEVDSSAVPLPVRTRRQPDAHFKAPMPVNHDRGDRFSTNPEYDNVEPLPPMTRIEQRAMRKKLEGRSSYRSRRTDR